ncbi:jg4551 [Pararge aegeria aegeria]|uniref:Jg4551 protein n=1 Tax=Pararge aegeria aegeria TaxID=348720 RepID=A0A8S4RQV7_9NEOP|nr:jg4551 [Pararge aegeria aegeria]
MAEWSAPDNERIMHFDGVVMALVLYVDFIQMRILRVILERHYLFTHLSNTGILKAQGSGPTAAPARKRQTIGDFLSKETHNK